MTVITNKCHTALLLYWSASPFVSAFLSTDSLPRKILLRRSTALFYFDDVSRDHTFGWTPQESDGFIGTGAAKEKTDALQRMLFGHDLDSASILSDAQVEDETTKWIKVTGLVASEGAPSVLSIYGGLLGLETHSSSSLVSCLASFWRSVVAFIDEYADGYHPTDIWETDNVEYSQLLLQIFPRCEELYDYDTFKLMCSAVEFCLGSCTHYGKRFKLLPLHPRYQNAPKMIYPEHHSPFPSMGLHVFGEPDAAANDDDQVGGDEIVRIGEAEDKEESITSTDIADFVPALSEKKRSLERLFNSPAAVSSVADSRSFGHTYQELSNEDIIAASKQWITDQRSENSTSLKYMNTVIDDMTKVSDATIAEQAYADIWEQISSLHDAVEKTEKFDVNVHGEVMMSSLFIAKTYSSYNASEFKRFAITVNAALKHLTNGKMFLELFHPEYCANNNRAGANHAGRRSPYPMIQVCYRLRS